MTWVSILCLAAFLICSTSSSGHEDFGTLILLTGKSPQLFVGAEGAFGIRIVQNTALPVKTDRPIAGLLLADDDGDDDDDDEDDNDVAHGEPLSTALVERIADGLHAEVPAVLVNGKTPLENATIRTQRSLTIRA